MIHLSPELLAYGIGPTVVVLAWLLSWAVLRRIPGWFFALALVASLVAVLSPFASPRSGPIANGTELDGLLPFANGATALVTFLVLLMVTGVLRLVLRAHRPAHPASATSRP